MTNDFDFKPYGENYPDDPGRTYTFLKRARDHFNVELFDGKLPKFLLTVQRSRTAHGYFSPRRFVNINDDDEVVHEVALNPRVFAQAGVREALGTLGHECVHAWQAANGKPSSGRYHNKEWARKMLSLDLVPSTTGEPGGKMTGTSVSHFIREGGRFDRVCAAFLAENEAVLFQDLAYAERAETEGQLRERARKAASKTCLVCPCCNESRTWGRRTLQLKCMPCDEQLVPE